MPSVVVATVGSASANSYVTIAEADAYLDDRLNASAWTGASDDDKARALFEAARELDLYPWKGSRVDSTQSLEWPRDYVESPDIPWATVEQADTYYYLRTVVPERVRNAQVEIALEFLRAGTTDLSVRDASVGIKRKKVDVLETEYFEPSDRPEGLERFPRISELVAPLLIGDGSGGVNTLLRA